MLKIAQYIFSIVAAWFIITPVALGADDTNTAIMALGKKKGTGASIWTVDTKTGKMKYVRTMKLSNNKKPVLADLGDVDANGVTDVVLHPKKYASIHTFTIEAYLSDSTSYTLEAESPDWHDAKGVTLLDYNQQGRDEIYSTYRESDSLGMEAFRLKDDTSEQDQFKSLWARFLIGDVQFFDYARLYYATSASSGFLDDSQEYYLALTTSQRLIILYRVDAETGYLSKVDSILYSKRPGAFQASIDSSAKTLYIQLGKQKEIRAYFLENDNLVYKPKKSIKLSYNPSGIGAANGLVVIVNKRGKRLKYYRKGKLIKTKRLKGRISSIAIMGQ